MLRTQSELICLQEPNLYHRYKKLNSHSIVPEGPTLENIPKVRSPTTLSYSTALNMPAVMFCLSHIIVISFQIDTRRTRKKEDLIIRLSIACPLKDYLNL